MKAFTVPQPKASLIVHGVKWIETRSRPTKIRGRIGIVAGMRQPKGGTVVGDYEMVRWSYPGGVSGWSVMHDSQEAIGSLPFGRLIGTVELYDCVPIESIWTEDDVPGTVLWIEPESELIVRASIWLGGQECDVTDQLPYGDFQRGRWAWLLRDPQPCEPVPMRGFQGWREIAA